MKIQKIIRIGNSAGIILPADFIRSAYLKSGDKVKIEYNKKLKIIFIVSTKYKSKIMDKFEFFTWLEEYTEKHKALLKELAKY